MWGLGEPPISPKFTQQAPGGLWTQVKGKSPEAVQRVSTGGSLRSCPHQPTRRERLLSTVTWNQLSGVLGDRLGVPALPKLLAHALVRVPLSVLPFRRRPDCSLNTLQSPRGRHLPSRSLAEVYQGNERSQLREMFHRDDTCKAQFLGRKWLLEAVTAPCLSDHHLDTSGPLLQSWRPGTHRGFLSHLFALHKNVLYCFYLTVGILHEGDPIPKMVLSSGGQAHCSTDFPRWLNVLGIHLDQCTSGHCCERLHSAAVNFFFFFWKTLSTHVPIS